MFATMLQKELRAILGSPKVLATFAVAGLLMVLSIQAGITDYRNTILRLEAARNLAADEMAHASSFRSLSMTAFRQPDPLQVFVVGVANDVGRFSPINDQEPVNLQNSAYTDNPLFALFRAADFAFIVTVVLSLFAILFTYDAINGEREQGTLALTFANGVSRVQYLAAKALGTSMGLLLPVALAVLLGLLLVVLEGVPLTGSDWERLIVLLGLSVLLFVFFIVLGILLSASTRHSSVSFLYCLAAWILFVLVLPRAGMLAATLAVPAPSYAEVQGQCDAYAKDQWEAYTAAAMDRWKERSRPMQSMTESEQETYQSARQSQWMNEEEEYRKGVEAKIESESRRIEEQWRLRKAQQQDLGFAFALVSPASAYQIAAMKLAGTDPDMKDRYENSMRQYRSQFTDYTEKKQKSTGDSGGMRITFNSSTGFSFSAPRERGTLDLSDMPHYVVPTPDAGKVIAGVVPSASIILGLSLFAVAGAMAAFLRYDLR